MGDENTQNRTSMPKVLMKDGEFREIPDEEMLSFLHQNRHSLRKRPIMEKINRAREAAIVAEASEPRAKKHFMILK